ncbi:UNVERIFIED_CONTAM: hypothetical protein GTU68_023274, partial [Idotea baltica]|nr:hypothetical protein [Idotea baltica]
TSVANQFNLHFTNRFTSDLPADEQIDNVRRHVTGACFSRVVPARASAPQLVAYSPEVAEVLGISDDQVETPAFADLVTGNLITPDMDPYAMCYGGHQFGNWAGQLGDGRAIALGEVLTEDDGYQTLQLKGAGPTPYSRRGDGYAVMRSSVREFLCSEAMFHLGVPTTRALSLTLTGDKVMRDMFYDGNPADELGAVVCRVSPSFVRFGNFELFTARDELAELAQLVNWTIRTDFPDLIEGDGPQPLDVVTDWFAEIVRSTAAMIVDWMRIGFVHGVMNTDNMSILGLTIDYGPYGWLEGFDPDWTPNTTDAQGRRYRYGNQPSVAHWNLVQLANAIAPLYGDDIEPLQEALDTYADEFGDGWNAMMAERLGFIGFAGDDDNALFGELGRVLQLVETDMTIFHRNLATVDVENAEDLSDHDLVQPIADAWYREPTERAIEEMAEWLRAWADRCEVDGRSAEERKLDMDAVNPKYVLRNWMAQLAIDKVDQGDTSGVNQLLDLLRFPYDEQPEHEAEFFVKRPEWARERAGCSMLSCSS